MQPLREEQKESTEKFSRVARRILAAGLQPLSRKEVGATPHGVHGSARHHTARSLASRPRSQAAESRRRGAGPGAALEEPAAEAGSASRPTEPLRAPRELRPSGPGRRTARLRRLLLGVPPRGAQTASVSSRPHRLVFCRRARRIQTRQLAQEVFTHSSGTRPSSHHRSPARPGDCNRKSLSVPVQRAAPARRAHKAPLYARPCPCPARPSGLAQPRPVLPRCTRGASRRGPLRPRGPEVSFKLHLRILRRILAKQ